MLRWWGSGCFILRHFLIKLFYWKWRQYAPPKRHYISTRFYIPKDITIHCSRHEHLQLYKLDVNNKNSVAWVRERTIPIERPLLVGEVSATFADRGCHVVRVTNPYGHILAFLDQSRYFFFQLAPQLYSRGWVDPVPDPLLLRKTGSAGNRTRTSGSVARNLTVRC
jgi:hypothetical protein